MGCATLIPMNDSALLPMMKLRVGVVGGGFAGLSAACFLHDSGHEVEVFERVPVPKAIGAGIMLQPTGQFVLSRLGMLDEVIAKGDVLDGIDCNTKQNKPLLKLRYSLGSSKTFAIGIHRGALFDTLLNGLKQRQIPLHTDTEILRFDSNTRAFTDTHNNAYGDFDLCVVADGNHSILDSFQTCGWARTSEEYPYGALWFVGTRKGDMPHTSLIQTCEGTEKMLGLLPSGRFDKNGLNMVSLFWSVALRDVPQIYANGLSAFKDSVLTLAPHAEEILSQIQSMDDVIVARYRDTRMFPYHHERMVAIGDAAHAMSPQLGQGANLGLWDAMVLVEQLSKHRSLDEALSHYSESRKNHLSYYRWISRWLTPFFQSQHSWLRWIRDFGMPLLTLIPFSRNIMFSTLIGICQGVFRKPLNLSHPQPNKP